MVMEDPRGKKCWRWVSIDAMVDLGRDDEGKGAGWASKQWSWTDLKL